MIQRTWFSVGLALGLAACGAQPRQEAYSPRHPPPASFLFAGPIAEPDQADTMSVWFRYVLAIHSLKPTRIQIIDAETGTVILDDAQPQLKTGSLIHPSDPSITIFEWEGRTVPEQITATSPTWLYAPGNISARLEARVHSADRPVFTFSQSATYSYAAKVTILDAVKYNRSLQKKAN